MGIDITLYELGPSRSARARWALLEAGLDFKSIEDRKLLGSDELKKVHPLGKFPAILIDGKPLFESAAICTKIADLVPEKDLIAKPGTWDRALHDQWVCFALTEMEAYTWSNALNTFVLPEEKRVPAMLQQNADGYTRGAAALNAALGDSDYLIGNRFSVTDIIVGYTVNWGRRQGYLDNFSNLQRYVERLFTRPHCALNPD